jgi:predicted dehydrogenase
VLQAGTLAAVAAGSALAQQVKPGEVKTIRIGFVGTGGRGTELLHNILRLEGVKIPAICDINEKNLARAQDAVVKANMPKPEGYSRSETDFKRLCDRTDLDLVLCATPWQWHTPVCVAAMNAGKHAATEVPAAQTVEECWQLVDTSEKTGKQCVILENDCYYRETLLILNMIRQDVLGDVLFAEAGYLHDIRAVKLGLGPDPEQWRGDQSANRNGNLYPTHPIGPLAWWMDINRGDRFSHLVSMSTKSRSLKEYAVKHIGGNDPRATRDYKLGDVNTTLIRTEKGKTISLYHDTNTPRPKEGLIRVQGTKGVFNSQMNKVFIEGRSNHSDAEGWKSVHEWEDTAEYRKQYDHKLWQEKGAAAANGGHGGIDYLELYRLVKNLQAGKPHDIDVYDAASWSVIVPLSEASVAGRSKSMDFPDFTRGKWKTRQPVDVDAIV